MRLNMGCGYKRLDGWVNVDSSPVCGPDQVVDLESTPWPWADNSAAEVLFHHSLEHMGADSKTFLGIIKELYRVAAPDAVIQINVPHPRHDHFIADPTHVRIVTPDTMTLFDRRLNDQWKAQGASNTPLAHYLGVDFVIENVSLTLDEPFATDHREKRLADEMLRTLIRLQNNVVTEYQMRLRARK
jgi:predicted SAM-dependent methyltransferase